MSYLEGVIFGIVQGITEFIPISSTAHIIMVELLLGYQFPGLAFEIYLHLASALAVIVFFRRELLGVITGFLAYVRRRDPENRVMFYYGLYIIVATAITGVLGLSLKALVVNYMKTPYFMAGALMLTGLGLIVIERFHKYGNRREGEMTWRDAVVVGLGQTLAVLPGVSRSGATLLAALGSGLERETAVRYSFILVIPAILGSTVLALGEFRAGLWWELGSGPLLVAFLCSLIFSWLGLLWLLDFLRKSRLLYFALYLFAVALLLALRAPAVVL